MAIGDGQQMRECFPKHSRMITARMRDYYIIIIILESAVQGRERVRTLSVQRPQPHTTNPWKEEEYKTVGDKKERGKHWFCS